MRIVIAGTNSPKEAYKLLKMFKHYARKNKSFRRIQFEESFPKKDKNK